MTTDPTPTVRRYVVHDNGHDVIDTATGAVIDVVSNPTDAEAMALALNRVEMSANRYVVRIMQHLDSLGERAACGLCGTRYPAPGMTACSTCGGA